MKNLVFLALSFLASWTLVAQSSSSGVRISAGYFAPFAIEPGGSLSVDIPVGNKAYVLRPQLAVFTNPENHYSILTAASFSRQWYRQKKERWRYHRLGIGLGYGLQYEQEGLSVSLGDGQITGRDRVQYDYLFPHLTYGYGRQLGLRWGWYGQLSVGHQFGMDDKGSMLLNTELGVFYTLNQ